ncbi:TPA: hypothetical protein ACHK60_005436, partial [Escherichia coli]
LSNGAPWRGVLHPFRFAKFIVHKYRRRVRGSADYVTLRVTSPPKISGHLRRFWGAEIVFRCQGIESGWRGYLFVTWRYATFYVGITWAFRPSFFLLRTVFSWWVMSGDEYFLLSGE